MSLKRPRVLLKIFTPTCEYSDVKYWLWSHHYGARLLTSHSISFLIATNLRMLHIHIINVSYSRLSSRSRCHHTKWFDMVLLFVADDAAWLSKHSPAAKKMAYIPVCNVIVIILGERANTIISFFWLKNCMWLAALYRDYICCLWQ